MRLLASNRLSWRPKKKAGGICKRHQKQCQHRAKSLAVVRCRSGLLGTLVSPACSAAVARKDSSGVVLMTCQGVRHTGLSGARKSIGPCSPCCSRLLEPCCALLVQAAAACTRQRSRWKQKTCKAPVHSLTAPSLSCVLLYWLSGVCAQQTQEGQASWLAVAWCAVLFSQLPARAQRCLCHYTSSHGCKAADALPALTESSRAVASRAPCGAALMLAFLLTARLA